MSARAQAWVRRHSQAKGLTYHVLLAIAGEADRDGVAEHVTLAWICREVRCYERTIFYALRRLQELGELEVTSGAAAGKPNRYRLPIDEARG